VIACVRVALLAAVTSLGLAVRAMAVEANGAALPADAAVAPPVDSLVAEALRRSPELAAARERLAAARERTDAAGALAYPKLEASLTNVGFDAWTVGEEDMSVVGVELTQELPWPGKRGARQRATAAAAVVEAAALQAQERETVTAVRTGYARLYALDRTLGAARGARDRLRMLAQTVATRYSAGQTDMEALLKSQLAVSRLDQRLADLETERSAAATELNRILDRPTGSEIGNVQSIPEPAIPAAVSDSILGHTPQVGVRRAAVDAAVEQVEVERREGRPDWMIGAGYGARGGLDPIASLRIGTELPLWGGGASPRRRAAEHEVASARYALQAAHASARAEAERWLAAARLSNGQVQLYRDAILPQSAVALEAARAAYESGRGDFSTVVEDFDLWLEAQQQLASREAERYANVARLAALAGGEDPR
jgi:outer membrane protein TolC